MNEYTRYIIIGMILLFEVLIPMYVMITIIFFFSVMELVHSVEEFGTSSDGWEKNSHNMGVSTETCQEVSADLKKEADRKDAILKNITSCDVEHDPSTIIYSKLHLVCLYKIKYLFFSTRWRTSTKL